MMCNVPGIKNTPSIKNPRSKFLRFAINLKKHPTRPEAPENLGLYWSNLVVKTKSKSAEIN